MLDWHSCQICHPLEIKLLLLLLFNCPFCSLNISSQLFCFHYGA